MKIIDFRIRPPIDGILKLGLYTNPDRRDRFNRMLGFEPAPSAVRQDPKQLFAEMDDVGVVMGVIVGRISSGMGSCTLEDVANVVAKHPDRFVGIGAIDPINRKTAMADIDRAMKLGLKAINIEPGGYSTALYADDRRLYPIYAKCEDAGIPVIVMTGGNPGPDLSYTSPITIDRVAADFPTLKIIVSHGNWPWVHEILHVCFRRPNVYLSPDMYLYNMPGMDDYVRAADTYLSDRFIYASSYPLTPVDAYAKWFSKLPLRPESMEKVVYKNAAALLKISP